MKYIEFNNTKEQMMDWIIKTGNTLYDVVYDTVNDYTDINVELVDGRTETYCRIYTFNDHEMNQKMHEVARDLSEYLESVL